MSLLRFFRNVSLLLIITVAAFGSRTSSATASDERNSTQLAKGSGLFCGGTCNPRYGPSWCRNGCKCYGASTRGICLPG